MMFLIQLVIFLLIIFNFNGQSDEMKGKILKIMKKPRALRTHPLDVIIFTLSIIPLQ